MVGKAAQKALDLSVNCVCWVGTSELGVPLLLILLPRGSYTCLPATPGLQQPLRRIYRGLPSARAKTVWRPLLGLDPRATCVKCLLQM